ncbi:serotriflin-like [Sceloporus undulatus]|uniref:serotriflin-like n=1 Tax=Sceloporus undulatus TaxID=8520 RepID=UPI001C4CAA91|nr:serotriflin-like [Sceloporus undulatus]XP_042330702.1 serotriflin-like [Sceloporus undulatus]
MALLTIVLCLAAALQLFPGYTHAGEQDEIVGKHNDLRRGVKPTASNMLRMEWNSKAAENAKKWANQCTFSHSSSDKRIVDGINCGENLYMSSAPASWSKAIQTWYDEVKDFKYGTGATSSKAVVGHFTQVVWYRSYLVGCFAATCSKGAFKHYYVCHYCPAGNLQSLIKTPYKSGPPCGDCPSACDKGLCTNPCKYVDKFSNCNELVKKSGCKQPNMLKDCAASCLCTTEIK